jgi:hypothetical protein
MSTASVGIPVGPQQARAQQTGTGRYYPQTGKTLAPEFIAFYDSRGGLPIFGYPLTDVEVEGGYRVQYLERARFEYHPEHRGTPYEVQLGLLGSILTAGRYFPPAPPDRASTVPGRMYFPETGHTLSEPFLSYWQRNGGLALFGYPISEPVQEGGYTVQYFQRNRFEHHPEYAGTAHEVQLGLLGRDLLAQRVQIREGRVSLPTYAYEQALYTPPDDVLAPYPRLDFSKIGSPTMRSYRLIVMENRYLRLSIMPELGGRLYEAVYKPTGHNQLYRNPVVKPSPFGARGWWLGVGGTEWAAPTEEHGLMEYLPWDADVQRNTDGGATVIVSATDRLTGMKVIVGVTLGPEESAYTISARMENRTARRQSGQLWANTMLAPGGTNYIPPRTRFVVPTDQMVVHSTDDPALPPARGVIGWPRHEGRDLSDLSTWQGWLGAFALPGPTRGSFAAVYNLDADEGMVKTFDGGKMPGLKIFSFGPNFDPQLYTDDRSGYVELWGGITPTFWDNAVFQPNTALGWVERWQPVAGLEGVSIAGGWGTVSVQGGAVRILPVRRVERATLLVRTAEGQVLRQTFNASPDRPTIVTISSPSSSPSAPPPSVREIEVLGTDGRSVLKGAPVR